MINKLSQVYISEETFLKGSFYVLFAGYKIFPPPPDLQTPRNASLKQLLWHHFLLSRYASLKHKKTFAGWKLGVRNVKYLALKT